MPGNSSSVAVARKFSFSLFSSSTAGIAIYDDGIKRGNEIADGAGSNRIKFISPSTLFGLRFDRNALTNMTVDSSGVQVSAVGGSHGADIQIDNGRIDSTTGEVISADTLQLVGTLAAPDLIFTASVLPDSSLNRVFFLSAPDANMAVIHCLTS